MVAPVVADQRLRGLRSGVGASRLFLPAARRNCVNPLGAPSERRERAAVRSMVRSTCDPWCANTTRDRDPAHSLARAVAEHEVVPEKRIAYGWRYGGCPGDSTVVWELSGTLARRGASVTVVCRDAEGVPDPAVQVVRLAVPRFWQPLRVLSFSARAAAATRSGFDVVHGFARTRRQDVYRAGGGSHSSYLERVYPRPGLQRLSPRHRVLLAIEGAVFRDARQTIQCNSRLVSRKYER